MPSSPGERGASAPIGRPSRTASRGRALGGVSRRLTGVTALFGLTFGFDADLGFGFGVGFGCATRGGVNVARGAGVVACAMAPAVLGVDVEAPRVDDGDPAPGEGSGAGGTVPFDAAVDVVADDAEIGASGVGTAGADS